MDELITHQGVLPLSDNNETAARRLPRIRRPGLFGMTCPVRRPMDIQSGAHAADNAGYPGFPAGIRFRIKMNEQRG
jgi:hypothetical protein